MLIVFTIAEMKYLVASLFHDWLRLFYILLLIFLSVLFALFPG